jgi:glucose/arabinose dehydrogenase
MRTPAWWIVAAALAVTALTGAACGSDPAGGGAGSPAMIDAPTRAEVPWEELPGFDEATQDCPEDLRVDPIAEPPGPGPIQLEPLIDLAEASAMTFVDDGTAYVADRRGRIHRWDGRSLELVVDRSENTSVENDAGLLGMAVSPDGAHLFVYAVDASGASVVDAYPLENGLLAGDRHNEILRAEQPTSQHNGGSIVFDAAGNLYLSLGDGGGHGDPFRTSQDVESPFGAILRLSPRPGASPGAVAPADNPFVGPTTGHDLVWAKGVRNAFRSSIDPATGDLWVGDVGQQCVEEISVLAGGGRGGENLGWNVYEGRRPFLGEMAPRQVHNEPLLAYSHTEGRCAVIAGRVYHGTAVPELEGDFVFADFCSSELIALDPATGEARVVLQSGGLAPAEIVADPAGELYLVDMARGVWRIVPS